MITIRDRCCCCGGRHPAVSLFRLIKNDGKVDRRVAELGLDADWEDIELMWRWPVEFLCGFLHYHYGHDECVTIAEQHPWIVERHRDKPPTYLDILPTDMKIAILVPMCRRVLLNRGLSYSDTRVGSEPQLVAAMECDESCCLLEAIDRVVSGCQAGCLCRAQHRNVGKAAAMIVNSRLAPRDRK